jgi:hypothetical protein
MHTRSITRALALGAAAVTAGAVLATAPPAVAGTTTTKDPAKAAAGFLARHLQGKHHDHYLTSYQGVSYPQYGETADAVLSMDAAGVAQRAATRATTYLESHAAAYASYQHTWYPGALAKLILVATAQHVSVHDFGGLDLVQRLRGLENAGTGEFANASLTVNQALAVLALAVAPHAVGPDAAAVGFLKAQQCSNGGFQESLRANTAAPCGTEVVDDTAYAVQALLTVGTKTAAADALRWLRSQERDSGGFVGAGGVDANSTALALQALVQGHAGGVPAARGWLLRHQMGCSAPIRARGAVRVSGPPSAYDAATALLATSQAGAALAGKPLAWIDGATAAAAAPVLAC